MSARQHDLIRRQAPFRTNEKRNRQRSGLRIRAMCYSAAQGIAQAALALLFPRHERQRAGFQIVQCVCQRLSGQQCGQACASALLRRFLDDALPAPLLRHSRVLQPRHRAAAEQRGEGCHTQFRPFLQNPLEAGRLEQPLIERHAHGWLAPARPPLQRLHRYAGALAFCDGAEQFVAAVVQQRQLLADSQAQDIAYLVSNRLRQSNDLGAVQQFGGDKKAMHRSLSPFRKCRGSPCGGQEDQKAMHRSLSPFRKCRGSPCGGQEDQKAMHRSLSPFRKCRGSPCGGQEDQKAMHAYPRLRSTSASQSSIIVCSTSSSPASSSGPSASARRSSMMPLTTSTPWGASIRASCGASAPMICAIMFASTRSYCPAMRSACASSSVPSTTVIRSESPFMVAFSVALSTATLLLSIA